MMRLDLLVVASMPLDLRAHQVCVCVQVSVCIGGCASEYVQAHPCVPSVKPSVCLYGDQWLRLCACISVCVHMSVYMCVMRSHITLALMSSFSGMGGGGWEFPNHQPKHYSPLPNSPGSCPPLLPAP